MAYKISDDCISCGACAAECPVEAISEGDGKYETTRNSPRRFQVSKVLWAVMFV